MNVADEFLLLSGFGEAPSVSGIKTRELGVLVPAGAVLLGLDSERGRHLLVPVGAERVAEDRQSRHVTVSERILLGHEGQALRFVDLACGDQTLARVFEQLVEDVVSRLAEGAPADLVCQIALDDWRDLLRGGSAPIAREKALGLFGELTVLEMLSGQDPVGAVTAWVGPSGAPRDFVCGGRALEIKTTASVDGDSIRVSNIDQLDPIDLDRLDLVVVHVREDENGDSLDDLIERILRVGVPRKALMVALEAAGYVFGSDSTFAFSVRSCRSWLVDEDFPSMRVADIDPQRRSSISHVTYDLALTSEPSARDSSELGAQLEVWTTA